MNSNNSAGHLRRSLVATHVAVTAASCAVTQLDNEQLSTLEANTVRGRWSLMMCRRRCSNIHVSAYFLPIILTFFLTSNYIIALCIRHSLQILYIFFNIQYNSISYILDKKLSCRRQIARCFMSLNTALCHSESFEMIPSSTACVKSGTRR